ncbi:portal protein [Shewanella sp. phage 1/44]|uniref:portal protein n=1 Tax=Shewanella sp. phage 1/44 TaxID=1458862 RepID=UPI0004F58440|nr:portal protein [Shewanella sp. phage 1/44]AHK11737.1 portal protein [Shewanella sp. phage 1/44]
MNPLDAIINFISPQKGLSRTQARYAQSMVQRSYDAASDGRRNSGWWRPKTSAAQEVSKAADKLAATGQELCRNNPLAHRIKMIWAANIVGNGIRAELATGAKKSRKKANDDFTNWAKSTNCDFEGHYNFYGLQWLWAATVVESGGVFIRRHVNNKLKIPLQLQTIEQGMLDKTKNNQMSKGVEEVVDGVQFDNVGQISGYWIYEHSPDGMVTNANSKFHARGTEIIHIFRKERAGQHLGISWLAQSATALNDYATLKDAKLMQQQILACMAVIIESASTTMGLSTDKSSGTPIDSIEPGMIEYVPEGTKVHTVTPPSGTDNGLFTTNLKDDIAIGAGLASSQMTGDYSKLNFASGRMSKIEFFQVLDFAQDLMMLPALNTVFDWFNLVYGLSTNSNSKMTVEWTFPPRGVVQPGEELEVNIKKTRAGIISPSKLNKMYGTNLGDVVSQWKLDKITFGGLPFDIDPSLFSIAGNQLNVDDAASSNKADSTKKPDANGDV